jgi:protein-disulfide isomerase
MRSENSGLLLVCLLAATLGACSRSGEPPAAATPASAATEPAAAAAPAPRGSERTSLPPDLVARLVRPHSPVLGAARAPVTVIEVLDPACEACKAFAPVVEQLLFTYPEEVRVVVRYADFHPVSLQAIRLLEAARVQGKAHELLEALFERQQEWASHTAPDPARAWTIAKDVGIDIKKAQQDALAPSVDAMLHLEADDLNALEVEQTPTFFVNGKPLPTFGAQELMDLVASEVRNARSSAR